MVRSHIISQISLIEPNVVYNDFKICDIFNVMDKIDSIDIPSLILCGNKDRLTPVKYSEFFKEKIDNSKLIIIKKAGHMVMLERPEETNSAIEKFVNEQIKL